MVNVYADCIKREFLPEKQWEKVNLKSNQSKYTLVVGAGVTAGIVGQWNQLLNEVALSRVIDDNTIAGVVEPDYDKLRNFVYSKLKDSLFPAATDVLEKGDYLLLDPEDHMEVFELGEAKSNRLREEVFARRVWSAIQRLMRVQLVKRDYVQDYLDWCDDKEISFFKLKRKDMDQESKIEEGIKGKGADELIKGINNWLQSALKKKELRKALEAGDCESLRKMIPYKVEDETLDNYAKKGEDAKKAGKDVSSILYDLLVETAKKVMWLPDYCTLDALLDLSLKGCFQSIITYNFDTVFDWLLANKKVQKKHGVSDKYRVEVYGIHRTEPEKVLGTGRKTVKVYHVHGILDTPPKGKEAFMEKVEPIIFSGGAYEAYQGNHFNLGSIRIASARHEGNLLCVGFSGTDANFRSIVREFIQTKDDIVSMKTDGKEHDIYITRGLQADCKAYQFNLDLDKTNDEASYYCLKSYMNMLKEYFEKKLNAHIIWDDNFKEMADNLKNLV